MGPSRQTSGPNILVIGYDPGSDERSSMLLAAMSRSTESIVLCNSYPTGTTSGFTNNFSDFTTNYDFRRARRFCAFTLVRTYGRLLTPSEKAYLREINAQPTKEGREACQQKHNQALDRIETLPHLNARFDRRIPCWRAGRWKSLT